MITPHLIYYIVRPNAFYCYINTYTKSLYQVLLSVNYPVAEPRGIFKNQKLTAYCHDTLYIALLPLPLPHPQHSLQNTHHSKTPPPKLLSHLWKFPKYHLGTLTFQYPNYLSRRILGWCTKKYMHVILYYCHPLYIKLICLCNFSKYFLYPLRYIFSQNHLPVLWYPYKMILKIIYSMMCSFYWAHTQILYSLLPKGQTCFHPRSRTTGYSTGILIKR